LVYDGRREGGLARVFLTFTCGVKLVLRRAKQSQSSSGFEESALTDGGAIASFLERRDGKRD